MMCFTKQRINNLTRREIQNLFSRKTKAKPQAKMPDWDDEAVKPSSWEGLLEPLLWPKQASKKIFNLWLKLHYFFYKKWKRLCDENKRRRRIEEHRAFDPSAFTLPRTRGCTLNLSQKVVTSPAAGEAHGGAPGTAAQHEASLIIILLATPNKQANKQTNKQTNKQELFQ